MRVYLDHGATTPTDEKVVEAMLPYFTEIFGNPSSIHEFGREANKAIQKARETIAAKLNANPSEILFTSGGTESDNLAIKGTATAAKDAGRGNHIITSKIEHPAVLRSFEALEKEGFKATYLNVDREGFVDLEQLKESITNETILVSVMHANNEVGTIQDIDEIAKICKENNVIFHTDAVQSFTKVPLDVQKIPVDLVSMSSHKIHGPKGVGALYVRKGTPLKKLNDGGGHEFGMRAGTENVTGFIGFAKAVELTTENEITDIARMRDKFVNTVLEKIPDVKLNGPGISEGKRLCNNANLSFKRVEGESILMRLDALGIAVSTGSACSSKSLKASHVLTSMNIDPLLLHSSLRITLGRENTDEEIDYTIESLEKVISDLRSISPL
ncbi:MAG: cysteine desulfurase [Candidatus Diapherotrites archaeon]|nr:cysteine desulfurase [Candidatus Diapherotrites archaeon]